MTNGACYKWPGTCEYDDRICECVVPTDDDARVQCRSKMPVSDANIDADEADGRHLDADDAASEGNADASDAGMTD